MLSSARNFEQTSCSGRNPQDRLQQDLTGELAPRHGVAFETALRVDPQLAAQVKALQWRNERLRALRSDILHEPVPEQLMAALNNSKCAASRQGFSDFGPAGRVARLRSAAAALLSRVIGSASARHRTRS